MNLQCDPQDYLPCIIRMMKEVEKVKDYHLLKLVLIQNNI
jgi:hypothetical protein